ncbi:hypothetical protein [Marivita cryptomonadis]|uniref:hypothetical protein n=1 Tax=Marivita cryptomonadis TaxID=505252 RepID=UPI00391A849F
MVDTSGIAIRRPNVDVSTLTEAEVNTILSVIHSGDRTAKAHGHPGLVISQPSHQRT